MFSYCNSQRGSVLVLHTNICKQSMLVKERTDDIQDSVGMYIQNVHT